MPEYHPPIDDYRFLWTAMFDFDGAMRAMGKDEIDAGLALSVLEQAGRFCAEVLAPINRTGDEEGARLENGTVIMPARWAEAWAQFVAGGWPSLSADPEWGGQGLPFAVQLAIDEMIAGSNAAFGLFPGLTRGAAEAIEAAAGEALRAQWLPPLVSGRFTAAMALTEAHAGTDLSLLKTSAEELSTSEGGDGAYAITGTKIFISSGDHEMADNVVHLVLARISDAPPGVKGISLFLVPKLLSDEDGAYTVRNAMAPGALEKKMGMHAQPTCVMNYDGATGWLVGEPHRGMAAMFVMMNSERIFVGIEGLGIAHGAYSIAAPYAQERLQGRAAGHENTAPIIAHADVRRMLLSIRSFTEGARALSVFTALELDAERGHPDADRRKQASENVALLTPVVKAAFTDMGFAAAVTAQQVLGGHGYVREWGVEQYVRDARVTQIYEGTNGIQAMDLVTRKLALGGGAPFDRLVAQMEDETRAAEIPGGHPIGAATLASLAALREAAGRLRGADADTAGAAATAFLRLFAIAAMGWMWARMAAIAARGGGAQAKLDLAAFYAYRTLAETSALACEIAAGPDAVMNMKPEDF